MQKLSPREQTLKSIEDGFGGDTFRRKFSGDVAQCGCRWGRRAGFGGVLLLCPIHKAANGAQLAKFERERGK